MMTHVTPADIEIASQVRVMALETMREAARRVGIQGWQFMSLAEMKQSVAMREPHLYRLVDRYYFTCFNLADAYETRGRYSDEVRALELERWLLRKRLHEEQFPIPRLHGSKYSLAR